MAGIPERRSSISKAPRANGTYSIAQEFTDPTLLVVSKSVQSQTIVPQKKKINPVSRIITLVDVELTRDALLSTPIVTTNISLDKELNSMLRRMRIELRRQGIRVTLGGIVSHALISALENYTQWVHTLQSDARRTKNESTTTPISTRRTSLNLPAGIPAAAEMLVWKISEHDDAVIPSISGLLLTGTKWGLTHQEMWLPQLLLTKHSHTVNDSLEKMYEENKEDTSG
jgi:hypothetical protein